MEVEKKRRDEILINVTVQCKKKNGMKRAFGRVGEVKKSAFGKRNLKKIGSFTKETPESVKSEGK